MNKYISLIIPITFLLTGACNNKEKPADTIVSIEQATILDCSEATVSFEQPIPDNQYVDIIEDSGKNIVLLGNNTVEKYNNNGVLIWSKRMGLLGTAQNIIQANGDNYFISSANYQINDYSKKEFYSADFSPGTILRIHSYKTYAGFKLDNCSPMFNSINIPFNNPADSFISKSALPQNSSTCQLTKINKSGDVIWTKTFAGNYIIGKTLAKTPDGNWLLLTAKFSGFYQQAEFDANGVFQDTIFTPQHNNSLTLYKINATGNIIWERTLSDIYAPTANNLKQYESPIGMAVSDQSICINCVNDYIILDANGNTLRRRLPSVNTCKAAYPSVSFGNNHFYSLAKNSSNNYVQKSNVYGEVTNEIETTKFIPYGQIEIANGGFFIHGEGDITKFTEDGNYLWGKYSLPSYPIYSAVTSCSGGIIYLQKTAKGLSLIKTDINGNY